MATADFLDVKRQEIADRLTELKPLVDEYARLLAGAAALDGVARPAPVAVVRAGVAAASTRKRGTSNGKRGRPRGSGKRREQALTLVTANPGITAAEIAAKLDIQQTDYLYRVLRGLADSELVVKDGHGWKPVNSA